MTAKKLDLMPPSEQRQAALSTWDDEGGAVPRPPGVSEILCVSRMINSLAQHKAIFELDSQLRLGSMP
jgi:hypothetical protein